MRPRQEFPPATTAREALQRGAELMRDIPRLALDEALVKATGLPSDGQAWTDDKTRIYCQAVDMLRAHLPIWSITGYSQMVNDKERLAMMRRAAGVVR